MVPVGGSGRAESHCVEDVAAIVVASEQVREAQQCASTPVVLKHGFSWHPVLLGCAHGQKVGQRPRK